MSQIETTLSDEAILVKAFEPRMAEKAPHLRQWEWDAFHGRALRSERPGISDEQRKFMEGVSIALAKGGIVEDTESKARLARKLT